MLQTKDASKEHMSHTHKNTLSRVESRPYAKVLNTINRSSYMPFVAVIMDPSGPRNAKEAPMTDSTVVCPTTSILAQNADTIVM